MPQQTNFATNPKSAAPTLSSALLAFGTWSTSLLSATTHDGLQQASR